MGCSNAKPLKPPRNPIEELQFRERQMELCRRQQKNERQQVKKIRKKLAKRQKKQNSKRKIRDIEIQKDIQTVNNDKSTSNEESEKINQEEHNLQIESTIKAQLESNLCAFVIDQTALTMEYFGNYENELTSILAEFLNKENQFNKNFEEYSIILASPLDAAVSKWVRFRPTHGPEKSQSQFLQPPAIYVVFENIDILRPNDASYDSIFPLCRVNLETDSYRTTPCKEEYIDFLREIKSKGYVRLRLRDCAKTRASTEINTDIELKSKKEGIYGNKAVSMVSSGYGSEGDYDLTYITLLNMHQPLAKLKINNKSKNLQLNDKILPDSCVTTLGSIIDKSIFDENEDDDDDDDESDETVGDTNGNRRKSKAFRDYETMKAIRRFKLEQERRRKMLQQRYLNSKEFMCFFGELFRQKLSKDLLIKKEDLSNATYRSASIFTKDYEFIPAIHVQQNLKFWPECALKFRQRTRPVVIHPHTGEKVQWPTNAMLKQIETFGYHVIPLGYAPKKKRNPFRELEWRIVFPKAERYLERHLSHTQVKVLMMVKALVKTFIEPVEENKALLFVLDHFRTHLFWECEQDSTCWPEEFLGDVLIRFLESFMHRLRHKRLKDYFIEERNLFDSIPEYSLMSLYSILADITGNPLMHLLVAFRNLDLNEKFFPKLNFKKIFLNLVFDDMVNLKQLSKNPRVLVDQQSDESEEDLYLDQGQGGLVGMARHSTRTTGKLRRRTCQLKMEMERIKEEAKSRRTSVESIDVEFLFTNELRSNFNEHINQGVESLRRTNLLEILLEHLLEMVKKSGKFGNIDLAHILLAQAKRLNKLYDGLGCDMYAKDYEKSIFMTRSMLGELKDNDDFLQDAMPDASSRRNMKSRKSNKASDSDAYEEVIPMEDNVPEKENNLRKNLRLQQNKTDSSPESEKSIRFKDIIVEVHKTIEHFQEKSEQKRSRKPKLSQTQDKGTIFASNEETLDNTRNSRGYSPVDIFRDIRLRGEETSETSKKKNDSPVLKKKSIKFQKELDLVHKTPNTMKNDSKRIPKKSKSSKNGHTNKGFECASEELESTSESESSMSRAAGNGEEVSKVKKQFQETSFIESQKTVKKTKTYNEYQTDSNYSSDTNNSDEEIGTKEATVTNARKNLSKNTKGAEIIQIESDSSDSTSGEETPSLTFKCLQDISVRAILESNEPDDEDLYGPNLQNPYGICYDISPANSNDRILDYIDDLKRDKRGSIRSRRKSQRTKRKRQQRKKKNYKNYDRNDWESVGSSDYQLEDLKPEEVAIEIESDDKKSTESKEKLTKKSLFSKYINADNIVKHIPIISHEMIDTMTESKENIKSTMKEWKHGEKLSKVRDVLKEKTLKLKDALILSSET